MPVGTPVSLGTLQNKTAEAATTLVTTAVAPAGSVIVVAVAYAAAGTYLSTSNIPGTTYLGQDVINDGAGGNVPAILCWYHYVDTDVAAGTSITINWSTQPGAKAMTALYVPGTAASPLDVRGTATGSSSTPSVSTSGPTTQAAGITIGFVATKGPFGDTFTQDDSPAYSSPPVRVGTDGSAIVSNTTIAGGHFIETATGIKTYNPTLGTSRDWAAAIVTLKAPLNSYAYTGAGGGQSGGVGAPAVTVVPPASGGVIAAGLAALVLGVSVPVAGGAQSGGAALVAPAYSHAVVGVGGAQANGAAAFARGWKVPAAGGAQAGGAAAVARAYGHAYVGVGGAQSGGAAFALSGFTGRLLTVRLHDADGAPRVGAVVLARRVRVGGSRHTVVSPDVARAVTDADGVAVLTLMPSLGDAYRVTATAGDGTPLLDVAVLVGPGDGELHSLPRLEGMQAWH